MNKSELEQLTELTDLKSRTEAEYKALTSLVAFREKYIPSKDDVTPATFHEEWSKILLSGKSHFAVEAFRESAKTQIVIRANLLHALTFPSERRSYLVIICATQRTASKKLIEVSREFLSSPAMCKLVKEIRENSGLAFEVSYATGHSVRIEAYGKGAAVRGLSWGAKRPDLVIIDDPQDQEDAKSETVTANDWDWFLSDVYFLGQSSRIFLIGNNLGERCIIESVIRAAKRLNFTARKIPILTPQGFSAWPSKWPLKAIEEEREARNIYELYECYVKIDINGDGMLEDALISVVGDELIRITENPYGRVPIFTLSPIRDPFKVLANLSFAEIVGEIQTIKTALMRQMLINTVNTNNLRWFIDENGVDLKDIQANRQFIRVRTGNPSDKVVPFPQQGVAPWTMNLLENLEGALEQFTGRTRYNQGTDSRSLNKTATGISLLQQASEQRIDYIIRVFAETGVGEVLRFLVELNQRYMDQPQVIRLKNQMLQVTPDDLKGEFDIDVNTEAGVGKRKQTIENLQYFLTVLAPAGLQLQAITPGEWAKAAQKLLQESGIRDPSSYVLDPEIVKQQFFMALQQQMQLQAAQQAQSAIQQLQTGG